MTLDEQGYEIYKKQVTELQFQLIECLNKYESKNNVKINAIVQALAIAISVSTTCDEHARDTVNKCNIMLDGIIKVIGVGNIQEILDEVKKYKEKNHDA